MAKDWPYAVMVKEAADVGGPDMWIDMIKKAAYENGSTDTKNKLVAPLLVAGTVVGITGYMVYQKCYKWLVKKKEERQQLNCEAENAEMLLKESLDKETHIE